MHNNENFTGSSERPTASERATRTIGGAALRPFGNFPITGVDPKFTEGVRPTYITNENVARGAAEDQIAKGTTGETAIAVETSAPPQPEFDVEGAKGTYIYDPDRAHGFALDEAAHREPLATRQQAAQPQESQQ